MGVIFLLAMASVVELWGYHVCWIILTVLHVVYVGHVGAGSGISLGVMPPAGDISWMATIASTVPGVTPQSGLTWSASSTPMVAPVVAPVMVPVASPIVVMPAGVTCVRDCCPSRSDWQRKL